MSVMKMFDNVKGHVKPKTSPRADAVVFRLHYRVRAKWISNLVIHQLQIIA